MALVNYTNEYAKLKKIALYRPSIHEIYQGKPKNVMYTSKPDPNKILKEFDDIVEKFRELGIEVIVLKDDNKDLVNCPNMIFLRDVAAIVQDRIVLANMKFPIRKSEPEKFRYLLTKQDSAYGKLFIKLPENETMEGADILVSSAYAIFAHTKYRTSLGAIDRVSKILNLNVLQIPANIKSIPQHLLGGIHIVAPNLILRRPAYCGVDIDGYKSINLSENNEIVSGFAMNLVTISPRVVLMPANCPSVQEMLEKSGIKCHVIDISEIHKMGGGLACMTLPLEREAA